jgi:hypothetical protein
VYGVYCFVTEQFPDCKKLFAMCVNLNPDPRIRTSQRKKPLYAKMQLFPDPDVIRIRELEWK